MKRKLSTIEHILEGNIVCVVKLEGSFSLDQLRSALAWVQRKHPLRIVRRVNEDDCRRECQTELTTDFVYDQPQLRAVWLQSGIENDLLRPGIGPNGEWRT